MDVKPEIEIKQEDFENDSLQQGSEIDIKSEIEIKFEDIEYDSHQQGSQHSTFYLNKMRRVWSKKEFLLRVRNKKDILFGSFSDTITKEKKSQTWGEIANFAKSVCLIPREKDWTYARDVLWQNIKKSTMAKMDNTTKTGTRRVGELTEIDDLVLEIVGKESTFICNLGGKDSVLQVESAGSLSDTSAFPEDSGKDYIAQQSSHGVKRKKCGNHFDSEKEQLMKEYLKIKIYKTQLEALILEKKLGFPRSETTKDLPECSVTSAAPSINEMPATFTIVVSSHDFRKDAFEIDKKNSI